MKGHLNTVLIIILSLIPAQIVRAQTHFFEVRLENTSTAFTHFAAGAFSTPDGADAPAPIGPGEAYSFTFHAAPGARLSLATMFVHSNDLFYAPGEEGIALYDDGVPISGDVTDHFMLWDAGTEENQEPGVGEDQAPRQPGADTGADENGVVRLVDDAFTYPMVDEVIEVTVTPGENRMFEVRVANVSDATTLSTSTGESLAVPLSPGVWVVHTEPAPLFADGQPAGETGLEALAEDGAAGDLAVALESDAGVTTILSPGVWVVHDEAGPLFVDGEMEPGRGLEDIAEDGDPSLLSMHLAADSVATGGSFAVPLGAESAAPIGPGGAYRFTVAAKEGAALSLATMYVQSNDLFYAPGGHGIALFDAEGMPVSGEVSTQLMLWDAGTEVNERPGVGANQAPRQEAADTGEMEDAAVALVNDGYSYPTAAEAMTLTVTPLETSTFTVRVENVSTGTTLMTSTGAELPVPLSPGAWVVHTSPHPLFTDGQTDRGRGLEEVAEDGDPGPLSESLARKAGFSSGSFAVPEGSAEPAPIGPGGAYEFTVDAAPGAHLSLATMFVQSNDLFYAPDGRGIPLFDNEGEPMTGDATNYLMLWDAGTEVNQEPGVGGDQAPRQSAPDTGEAQGGSVALVDDAYTYPAVSDVIRVTIGATATPVEPANDVPHRFALEQNYPNPFNPSTRIRFSLERSAHARLTVYDVSGRRVATLADKVLPAGTHEVEWNGRNEMRRKVASGTYLYRLETGDRQETRLMVLLR